MDFNCDLGEGMGNETQIMPYIDSANIACGGHAGESSSIREAIYLAKKYGVTLGAHPSYPDKKNFGRISIKMKPKEFRQSIGEQLGQLLILLKQNSLPLHHIKPHGALYHDLMTDRALVDSFLECVSECSTSVIIYAPYPSTLGSRAKKKGFVVWYEAFADRLYNDDFGLVSRKVKGSVLNDLDSVLFQVSSLVRSNRVKTSSGKWLSLPVDTICIHSDTNNSPQLAKSISKSFRIK